MKKVKGYSELSTMKCKNCDKVFESKRKDAVLCSAACRKQWQRKDVTLNSVTDHKQAVTDNPVTVNVTDKWMEDVGSKLVETAQALRELTEVIRCLSLGIGQMKAAIQMDGNKHTQSPIAEHVPLTVTDKMLEEKKQPDRNKQEQIKEDEIESKDRIIQTVGQAKRIGTSLRELKNGGKQFWSNLDKKY